MAGAAQAIGWILQVDDQVSSVLDNLATKAVKTGKALSSSLFSINAMETLVDMLKPMFVDLQDTISNLKPVVTEVQTTASDLDSIFGGGRFFGPMNKLFFQWGIFITGWRKVIGGIKWFVGIPLRLIQSVVGLFSSILSPITTIIRSSFFKLFQDILGAIDFALKPVFMQLRILIIPFIAVFMPMLTRLVVGLMNKYVIPFVVKHLPDIQKGFQKVFKYVTTAFKDPGKAWKMFSDDIAGFWDKTLKPSIKSFWGWFKTDGLKKLDDWGNDIVKWAAKTAMPAVEKEINSWFGTGQEGEGEGSVVGDIMSTLWKLTKSLAKIVGGMLAPVGTAIITFGKNTWNQFGDWLLVKVTDFGFWFRDQWRAAWKWIKTEVEALWTMVGDEAVKILPEGAATLLGLKKAKAGSVMGQSSVAIARHAAKLLKKERAGNISPSDAAQLRNLREMDVPGLQRGGLVMGSPQGQLAIVGEKGTTEGVIPFGKDVPEADAVRMMQSAVMAASMAKGGAAAAGGGDAVSVLKDIENTLLLIADNTEDRSWMNDPDFQQSKSRKPWQT